MSDTVFFLKSLPAQISATVQDIPALNRVLLRGFWRRTIVSRSALQEQFVLRKYNIAFYFFINKSRTGRLFFFFKRKKRAAETVIDINIKMDVRPIAAPQPKAQLAKPVVFKWQSPPFLIADQEKRRNLIASTNGKISAAAIALTNGRGQMLLVDFEKNNTKKKKGNDEERFNRKARIWLRDISGEEVKNELFEADNDKNWRAQPFLILYESIRKWISGSWDKLEGTPIRLDDDNELNLMIQSLVKAFLLTKRKLREDHLRNTNGDFLNGLTHRYDLKNYHADLVLRLDNRGDFALFDSKRSFQLGLEIGLSEKEPNFEASLKMNIPDFLVEGKLYRGFWDLFLDNKRDDKLRAELQDRMQKGPHEVINDEDLTDLLEQARAGDGSVFRIERGQRMDINLFFISGRLRGEKIFLIFSAKLNVISALEPDIRIRKESLRIHYLAKDDQGTVDQDFVEYFLRIIWYFHKWIDVL